MTAKKYLREAPVTVSAIQFDGSNYDEIQSWMGNDGDFWEHPKKPGSGEMWDDVAATWVTVKPGQWVVKDSVYGYFKEGAKKFAKHCKELP